MSKKLSLNDELYEIISGVSDSTAAGMITDRIKDKFDDLLEEMRATNWGNDGNWTDAIDDTMCDWINENIYE